MALDEDQVRHVSAITWDIVKKELSAFGRQLDEAVERIHKRLDGMQSEIATPRVCQEHQARLIREERTDAAVQAIAAAGRVSVDDVRKDLDAHLAGHAERRQAIPKWLQLVIAGAMAALVVLQYVQTEREKLLQAATQKASKEVDSGQRRGP